MLKQKTKFFKHQPNSSTQLVLPLTWSNHDFRTHVGKFDEVSSNYKLNGQIVDIESQASYRVFGSIYAAVIDPLLTACSDLRTIRAYVRRENGKHFPTGMLSLLGGRYTKSPNPSPN